LHTPQHDFAFGFAALGQPPQADFVFLLGHVPQDNFADVAVSLQQPGDFLFRPQLLHFLALALQQLLLPLTSPQAAQSFMVFSPSAGFRFLQQPTELLFMPQPPHFFASALQHFAEPLISPHPVHTSTTDAFLTSAFGVAAFLPTPHFENGHPTP